MHGNDAIAVRTLNIDPDLIWRYPGPAVGGALCLSGLYVSSYMLDARGCQSAHYFVPSSGWSMPVCSVATLPRMCCCAHFFFACLEARNLMGIVGPQDSCVPCDGVLNLRVAASVHVGVNGQVLCSVETTGGLVLCS